MSEPSSQPIHRLHPAVVRWMGDQGWRGLRPVQAAAVAPLLDRSADVVIAAATAAGKTEAAFLPIATRLLEAPAQGVQALFLSPLKALINDQHRRLEGIALGLGFPVHRWHGDVASSRKARVIEDPRGCLLITPESLEAMFVLRGRDLARLFAGLEYVVVDELHAFLSSPRGRQLQALLRRLELVLGRRVTRVGLSATLGDMQVAQRFLRPEDPDRVTVLEAPAGELRLSLALHGRAHGDPEEGGSQAALDPSERAIAEHLFERLRGAPNLVFANRRRDVELYAARLAERCEELGVPVEFFPHHGSLARDLREDVEARLVAEQKPTTAICTSTLELGIDLGEVASVAQLGAPPSVAALRQRLGRAGRRGGDAVLRVYVTEGPVHPQSAPTDQLREELVRAIAMLELCLEGWCEPRDDAALHLSTLVQQVLSVIAQRHGASAKTLFDTLCAHGPFDAVDAPTLASLLRELGVSDHVMQDSSGLLLPGPAGERLLSRHTFYASFQTPEEYRVVEGRRTLGTLPVVCPFAPGTGIVFAGRRWAVVAVDEDRQVLEVRPSASGAAPNFGGGGGGLHARVRERQRAVLAGEDEPAYLDGHARELLVGARARYRALELDRVGVLEHGQDTWLFPWCGDAARDTLLLALRALGASPTATGPALCLERCTTDEAWRLLGDLESDGEPDPVELAHLAQAQRQAKYDALLGEELLAREYAARALDPAGMLQAVRSLIAGS